MLGTGPEKLLNLFPNLRAIAADNRTLHSLDILHPNDHGNTTSSIPGDYKEIITVSRENKNWILDVFDIQCHRSDLHFDFRIYRFITCTIRCRNELLALRAIRRRGFSHFLRHSLSGNPPYNKHRKGIIPWKFAIR